MQDKKRRVRSKIGKPASHFFFLNHEKQMVKSQDRIGYLHNRPLPPPFPGLHFLRPHQPRVEGEECTRNDRSQAVNIQAQPWTHTQCPRARTCTGSHHSGAEGMAERIRENHPFLPENLSSLRFMTFLIRISAALQNVSCHRFSALKRVLEFSKSNYLSQREY